MVMRRKKMQYKVVLELKNTDTIFVPAGSSEEAVESAIALASKAWPLVDVIDVVDVLEMEES
jgi:flavin-binding protein dodecin